ncbi:fasciclin domain-containing protein [Sphingomonas sp. ac-8]|uniref:fasciclin domain-containing protein n=1 Tax=Sphingomonas sp. ac-8 TaxID=3242977 RepID=UPI003A81382A
MFRLPFVSALAIVAATAAPALAQTTTATPAPQTAPQTPPAPPGTTPVTPVTPGTTPATPGTTQTSPGQTAPTQTAPGTTPTAPGTTATTPAKPNPAVGGAQMAATKPIAENLAAAPNLSKLVGALKAAGLEATLAGSGPFTVFAPNDAAFGRLAPGTMDTLLKPENKATLEKILNYHVVSGKLDALTLKQQIESAGGTLTLTTVAGQPLTAALENGALTLTDANGTKAYVTTYDVNQSNGVFHVVNGVLVPKLG